jgi:hypothetical protein
VNILAEELDVKINADSSKLTSELNKVKKALDGLNKLSKTINIKTTTGNSLSKIKGIQSILDGISTDNKINISLSSGQILNRLKAIDDRLKSINKNSNINLNITQSTKIKNSSTGGLGETERGTTITRYEKESYKTLRQQAKNSALEAEKSYNTGDFVDYKKDFMDKMNELVNFRKALGDISIGQERGIYANMARSLSSTSPLYSSLIDKVKELNNEQTKFNSITGKATAPVKNIGNEYLELQKKAVSAASAFNIASTSNKNISSAKQEYENALNNLVSFKSARGYLSYGAERNIYRSVSPQVQKDSAAYAILKSRIDSVSKAMGTLNNHSQKAHLDKVYENLSSPANFISNMGRATKGTGSAIEVLGRLLYTSSELPGTFGAVSGVLANVTAGFVGFGAAIYGTVQTVTTLANVLQTVGSVIYTALRPGIETYDTTTRGVLSLTAALQTMGNINGQEVTKEQAHTAAINLSSQALIRAQQSAFSYKEVMTALQGVLPLVLGKGMNAKQALDITTGVAGVAKLTGLNQNQVLQETRDLMQGTITARTSQVANALGITNQDLAQYRGNSEKLFDYLTSMFSKYSQALTDYSNTVPGSIEQLQETMGLAGQTIVASFGPAIVSFTHTITGMFGRVEDEQGRFLDNSGKLHNELGEDISDNQKEVDSFNESMTHFEISDGLKAFMAMLWDIADYIAKCVDEVYDWAKANGYIDDQQTIFQGIGDAIKLMIAMIVEFTEDLITTGVAIVTFGVNAYNALLPFLNILRSIIVSMGIITKAGVSQAGAIQKLLVGDTAGFMADSKQANKVFNADFEKYYNMKPLEQISIKDMLGSGAPKEGGVQATLRNIKEGNSPYLTEEQWLKEHGTGTKPSQISGTAKPDEKSLLQEAKRELADQKEIVKAELEDIKDICKNEMDSLDAIFSQGLITVEDYYSQKTAIEEKQAQAEVDAIKKEIALTEATPFQYATEKEKELVKLGRELSKATSALQKTQQAAADVARISKDSVVYRQLNLSNTGGTSATAGNSAYQSAQEMTDEVQSQIEAGVQDGFSQWQGITMDNMREGCVEAVTKIGDAFSQFLGDQLANGVVNVDVLQQNAKEAGIPEIPYDENKLSPGDVIVYDNDAHVLIYKGQGKTVGNSSSALDYEYGEHQGPGAVKEQGIDIGMDPTSIIKTGQYGLRGNYASTVLPNAVSSEGAKMRAAITANIADEQKTILDYAQLMAEGASAEIQMINTKLQEKIHQLLSQGKPDLAGMVEQIMESQIRDIKIKYSKQKLEYFFKQETMTSGFMSGKLGMDISRLVDNIKDIGAAVSHYFDNYFSLKNSKMLVNLRSLAAEATTGGNEKQVYEVNSIIDGFYSNLEKNIKSFITKIEDTIATKQNIVESNKFLTTGQKAQEKTRLDTEKAIQESLYYSSQILEFEYQLDQLSIAQKKATTEQEKAQYGNEINNIQYNILPALEMQRTLNNELAITPTLLEKVGVTAKQSLEDGLVTFLTDCINTCKTLEEAFNNLVVSILKDLQKMFANQLKNDIIKMLFPTTPNKMAAKAETENLGYNNKTSLSSITSGILGNLDFAPQYNNKNPQNFTQYEFSTDKINQGRYGSLVPNTFPSYEQLTGNTAANINTGTVNQGVTQGLTQLTTTVNSATTQLSSMASALQTSNLSSEFTSLSSTLETVNTNLTAFGSSLSNLSNTGGAEKTGSIEAHAGGGIISGPGTGISDSILSRVSNGEGIITAKRVSQLGTGFIHAVNRGDFSSIYARLPAYADGGVVGGIGSETTASGVSSFAQNLGSKVSTTNNMNIALVRDEAEAMTHFMKSGSGQRIMLDFSRKNASITSRF